jgi:hypothetical protein
MTLVGPGRRLSGRSEQRTYGILQRQDVWEKKAGASLPAGRQAPALHRIAGRVRLECGGLPPLSRAHQRQGLKRAQQAAPLRDLGTARHVWGGAIPFSRQVTRFACRQAGVTLRKYAQGEFLRNSLE